MAPVGSTVTHQASDFSPAVAPPGGRQTTGSSPNTNLNPLQDRMRQQTMDWLNNPSPYDDALWQREVDRARATYDQQTNTGRQRLEAELAGRGVDFGTIGGREFSDFESNRARGFDDILTGFLSDRARGISDARAQAFNAGNSERNYYDNLRQTARGNAMEEWQAGDQSSQRWLAMAMNALGIGTDNAGQASQGYGQTGAMAGAGNAELMKYLAEYFGTRPQVAAPGTRPSQVSGR